MQTVVKCVKCGEEKPRTIEFWEPYVRGLDGFHKTCRSCMHPQRAAGASTRSKSAAQKRYHERNPEKRKKLWDSWYARNRDHVLAAGKRYRQSEKGRAVAREYEQRYRAQNKDRRNLQAQARRYGLSVSDLNSMIEKQQGRCAICGSISSLHVDHDHGTGKVRELLCSPCNKGLGHFRDDVKLVEAARKYLANHSKKGDQLCLVIPGSKKVSL